MRTYNRRKSECCAGIQKENKENYHSIKKNVKNILWSGEKNSDPTAPLVADSETTFRYGGLVANSQ